MRQQNGRQQPRLHSRRPLGATEFRQRIGVRRCSAIQKRPSPRSSEGEGSGTTVGGVPTKRLSTISASSELTVNPSGRRKTGPSVGKLNVWLKSPDELPEALPSRSVALT